MDVRQRLEDGEYTNKLPWKADVASKTAYREEFAKIYNRLREDLFEEEGLPGDLRKPGGKGYRVFGLAWDRGHADGLSAVVDEFRELGRAD